MVTDSPRRPGRPLPPPDPGPVDPILRLPSVLMFEVMRTARRISMEMFPDEHLRLTHAAVLACLADRGPMSQREVSELLRYDPGDLVGVIDALEELEYVIRERDTRDRRRYSLQLTDAGRLALHERRNRGVRLNEVLFAPLNTFERDKLQTLLLRMLAHHDPRFADAELDSDMAGPSAAAETAGDARRAAEAALGSAATDASADAVSSPAVSFPAASPPAVSSPGAGGTVSWRTRSSG